jgi:thiol:disulfide interchange protein DsbA
MVYRSLPLPGAAAKLWFGRRRLWPRKQRFKELYVTSTALRALVLVGAAAFGAAPLAAQQAATPPFEAGKHYTVLSPAQPTSTDAGKIEVAEVFMYSCPGCFAFEAHIQRWLGRKADYINFVRIPAPWNPPAPLHARAYYTAEALGKAEEMDGDFFNEIHVNRNLLETEAKLAALFAKHGVDEATFKSTFNSFAVNAKVKRAEELVRRYRVPSTPTVIVNGKYSTTGTMAGSYDAWFAIIDDLAAREHAAAESGSSQ